jgi:peptidoglycan hydrolase FlgJ
MNVSAINSVSDAKRLMAAGKTAQAQGDPVAAATERKRQASTAAKQFEAIILRQLLAPAIEPMMNGGLEGKGTGGGGGGVYGYMLTDTLANSLSQGGGLGLSRILEKQLTPKGDAMAAKAAATYTAGKRNNHE